MEKPKVKIWPKSAEAKVLRAFAQRLEAERRELQLTPYQKAHIDAFESPLLAYQQYQVRR